MEALSLFTQNKERKWFFFIISILFLFNLLLHYLDFKHFTKHEVFSTKATVINIYPKEKYDVLKLQAKDFTFFTSSVDSSNIKRFDLITLFIVSKDINFYSYLKGFYAKTFNIQKLEKDISKKELIYNTIDSQHKSQEISSLYSALFIATPLHTKIREFSTKLGISHLIAISGFHLGVLSFTLYFLIHLIYSKIHQRTFPYRNKKFDIMCIIVVILFSYLLFIGSPPSLLRAFLMFIFALFLLRNNIKVISFETLFIISIMIIALFPKLLFSLSLWFSISGVFYIFLFIKYFKDMNKYIQFFFFNFWIYFAMNPITHYFFGTLSKEQLISPLLTILFTLFYPITLLLHIFNEGSIFDSSLLYMIHLGIDSIDVFTPLWLFVSYIFLSLVSVIHKKVFISLNVMMTTYNIWLFYFIF